MDKDSVFFYRKYLYQTPTGVKKPTTVYVFICTTYNKKTLGGFAKIITGVTWFTFFYGIYGINGC